MLLSNKVILKWNSKIKKHYVDLGYRFTKMKDSFVVNINDLTNGSSVIVNVQCDYCGKSYDKAWNRYLSEHNGAVHKDCCNDCKKYKIIETAEVKYGVKSVLSLEKVKNKCIETNIEKYGVENPFESKIIKNKIRQYNLKHYNCEYATQNKIIKDKTKKTCLDKYGETCFLKTLNQIGENSPVWKGGIRSKRTERCTSEYVEWRTFVFKRDNYTCQCCGKRGSELNAHHIENWKDNPDKRYDIDNGITFCKTCHIEFHKKYGKIHNTQEQVFNFLSQDKKVC